MTGEGVAILSNKGPYISFSFADRTIRFKGPYSLIRFKDVEKWDRGYLVVHAEYAYEKEPIEDYIDLIPILNDLYIDANAFIDPIRKVEVSYV